MEDAKRKEKELFEDMPVRKAVLTLAVPTVISQLIVLIYNLADTWFIGQTGDPLQVAAVTIKKFESPPKRTDRSRNGKDKKTGTDRD